MEGAFTLIELEPAALRGSGAAAPHGASVPLDCGGCRLREIVSAQLTRGPECLLDARLEFVDGSWGRLSQVVDLDWTNTTLVKVRALGGIW